MDDRQLMSRIAGGDEAALQSLLRRFTPMLRYILRPLLPDERDREECLADISLRIWQGAGSFDGAKGSLNGWLTALTRNAEILGGLAQRTGCKVLLAQKAFSNYDCYPLLAPHLAGTEASGLFEARLGAEEMPGKEVHVFCAAYRADEMLSLIHI